MLTNYVRDNTVIITAMTTLRMRMMMISIRTMILIRMMIQFVCSEMCFENCSMNETDVLCRGKKCSHKENEGKQFSPLQQNLSLKKMEQNNIFNFLQEKNTKWQFVFQISRKICLLSKICQICVKFRFTSNQQRSLSSVGSENKAFLSNMICHGISGRSRFWWKTEKYICHKRVLSPNTKMGTLNVSQFHFKYE